MVLFNKFQSLQDHNSIFPVYFMHFRTNLVSTIYFNYFRTIKAYNVTKLAKSPKISIKILLCPNNFKFGMNINLNHMSTFCKFQINWINSKCDVPYIHNKTHWYPYNFIHKLVIVFIYDISKNQCCNFNTFQEIKCFRSLQDHNINYKEK